MNKTAFIAGYTGKEASVVRLALKGGTNMARGGAGFLAPMAPPAAIDYAGSKLVDKDIERYRASLGLPPETPDVIEQEEVKKAEEAKKQNNLQEEASTGNLPVTT